MNPDDIKIKRLADMEANTGSIIICPVCKKKIRKRSYQHVFCSNRGQGNCKDAYWNTVDPSRMDRVAKGVQIARSQVSGLRYHLDRKSREAASFGYEEEEG